MLKLDGGFRFSYTMSLAYVSMLIYPPYSKDFFLCLSDGRRLSQLMRSLRSSLFCHPRQLRPCTQSARHVRKMSLLRGVLAGQDTLPRLAERSSGMTRMVWFLPGRFSSSVVLPAQ